MQLEESEFCAVRPAERTWLAQQEALQGMDRDPLWERIPGVFVETGHLIRATPPHGYRV